MALVPVGSVSVSTKAGIFQTCFVSSVAPTNTILWALVQIGQVLFREARRQLSVVFYTQT